MATIIAYFSPSLTGAMTVYTTFSLHISERGAS
jgi:hypothetical protein